MADWSSRNIMLTTKGAAAISKVQSGSGKLTITKVVASEQYVSESTLREVTSLSVENLPLTIIDRHEVPDGGSVIQVQLNNLDLDNPFVFNEIGVFATHSDNPSEEFLYIIAQVDADTGDRIPLYSTTPITATYDIYLYNVGADNIEVTISSSGLVTYEALNEACGMVKRSTLYAEGDIRYSSSLPIPYYLKCKVAGTTSSSSIVIPSDIEEGDTITDGTVTWKAIKLVSSDELQTRNWSEGHFDALKLGGGDIGTYLTESTGYGIVSGCEPSISGLTVTVGAGIVHLSDGTRKEIAETNITLDNADSTNPRIDLVYIDSTGTVAKITGTAAASPSAPTLPSQGISVAQVSVAANATAGTVTDSREFALSTNKNVMSVKSLVADDVTMVFNSVADMRNATELKDGMSARTLGYYSANDGGGGTYTITTSSAFINEPLTNGLYAELIVEDTLNLKQIGAKSRDSSFDNSPILKSAIDYGLSSKKYSTIYIPSGYYTFTTTIDLLSENKSLSVINLVGDGENWNGNVSGTVISYYGASNTYLFDFGVVSRCLFKRLLFTGSGSNKCFSIKNCYVTRFEDVQLQDFANAVWLREYCGYVYFDHCMFNCARNGTKGLIINTHYTDGREYTQQYNAEYIYITDCAFDAGDDLSNHVVVYGCHFLWISRCDFCNSADISILIDTTGWKSNILDVFIDSMSFVRNKIATKIIKGTGQAGRIKINGSWTRTEQPTVDDRILVTEGDGNVYQLELSGRCESYNSATYGVDAINAHMINTIIGEYNGRANDHEQRWYLYAPSKVTPQMYRKITPNVTVNGNKVTYDFSDYGTTNRFLSVCGGGIIGGTNGQCMVAFEFIHCYGSKITGNTGANISDVTISGKAITVTCAYNPSTYIGDMSFYALP